MKKERERGNCTHKEIKGTFVKTNTSTLLFLLDQIKGGTLFSFLFRNNDRSTF